jgi:hypothetical protein
MWQLGTGLQGMSHLRRSSTRSAARIGRPVRLLSILGAATLSTAAATADTTADVFGRGGTLSANPPLRRPQPPRRQLPASEQSNPADFYQAGPANYYAEFWHENAINGKQYGFPYDDDYANQSSDISVANPQYLIVAVGC